MFEGIIGLDYRDNIQPKSWIYIKYAGLQNDVNLDIIRWRVLLVVDGRGGACEVVDFVELPPERLRHVVQDEREALVVEEFVDVLLRAREEVVQCSHLVAVGKQPLAEMASEKSRATSYQCFFHIPVTCAV